MTNATLDVFIFKLSPGIESADFFAASAPIDRLFEQQPGFVSRRLMQGADGLWLDLVEFTSADQANSAAEVFMASENCDTFKQAIDMSTVQMHRFAQTA